MCKFIFLDIGSTLLFADMLSPPREIAKILKLTNNDFNILRKIIFCGGHTNVNSLISDVEKYISRGLSHEEKTRITGLWHKQKQIAYPVDGAHDFIVWLHKGPFKVHLASNLWYPFWDAFIAFFSSLTENLSGTLSFKCGLMKPCKGFYQKALEESGASPEEVIMIGDSLEKDIIPAVEMGMKAIWIRKGVDGLPTCLSRYQHRVKVAGSLFEIRNILNEGRKLC